MKKRKPFKKKIGIYIEVSVNNDMFDYYSKIQIHCKDDQELEHRLFLYKKRAKVLGFWDGKRFGKIKDKKNAN